MAATFSPLRMAITVLVAVTALSKILYATLERME